jgi:hypothetical protein
MNVCDRMHQVYYKIRGTFLYVFLGLCLDTCLRHVLEICEYDLRHILDVWYMFGTWFEEYLLRHIVGTYLGYIGIYFWYMVEVILRYLDTWFEACIGTLFEVYH